MNQYQGFGNRVHTVNLTYLAQLVPAVGVDKDQVNKEKQNHNRKDSGLPRGSVVRNPPADAGDISLIPGSSGRSLEGGNGNPLQYYYQDNFMDRGAWQSVIHGFAKRQTGLKQLSMQWGEKENMWIHTPRPSESLSGNLRKFSLFSQSQISVVASFRAHITFAESIIS